MQYKTKNTQINSESNFRTTLVQTFSVLRRLRYKLCF